MKAPSQGIGEDEFQIASIHSESQDCTIAEILNEGCTVTLSEWFSSEQRRDLELLEIIEYMEKSKLSSDPDRARQIAFPSFQFSFVGNTLLSQTQGTRGILVYGQ